MRRLDGGLLLRDFRSAELPVVSCTPGLTETVEQQHRSTYFPYHERFVLIVWQTEPTSSHKRRAAEIVSHHARSAIPSLEHLVEVDAVFAAIPANEPVTTEPLDSTIDYAAIQECLDNVDPASLQVFSGEGLPAYLFDEFPKSDVPVVYGPREVLENVTSILQAQAGLELFDGGILFTSFGGGGSVSHEGLARWLLARRLELESEEIVDQLQTFCEADATPATRYLVLSGINLKHAASLGHGISILPFREVPDSPIKRALKRINNTSATLAQRTTISPKMRKGNGAPAVDWAKYHKLNEVAAYLTLVGPCAPVMQADYFEIPGWIPCTGSGYGFSSNLRDQPSAIREAELPTFDAKSATEVLESCLQLEPEMKSQLSLPIGRLNLGIRKTDPCDRAIDLGIALETLLARDRPHDSPISYIVRLRGALLRSGTPEERKHCLEVIKAVYTLRSKAAHDGRIPDTINVAGKKTYSGYVLQDGATICADLIKAVIKRRQFPDWNDLTLGISP